MFVRFYIVLLVVSFGAEIAHRAPSYLDWLPVVSQVKSLVQVIGGDPEGAKQTQKTEKQFIFDFVEPTVNKIPVIGHVKGAVHKTYIHKTYNTFGDTKRGDEILKEAIKTGLVAVGGAFGGPTGAVSTSLLTDRLYTAIDSAIAQEYKPYGVDEYAQNIDKKSVGEHVDQWVDLVQTGLGIVKNPNNKHLKNPNGMISN